MEIKKNLIPNSTQIPNLILDLVIPLISEAEARCLLYICRRTFGFHKKYDSISLSQFEHGIRSRQGSQLDFGTGMSRPGVTYALKNLIKTEVIFMRKNSRGNRYMLNLHMDVDKVVNELNQLRRLTRSSKPRLLEVVNQVNPQKKGNKEKQSLSQSIGPPVDNRPEFLRLRAGLTDRFSLKNTNQTP
jgi:Bacteriophage replication protein O